MPSTLATGVDADGADDAPAAEHVGQGILGGGQEDRHLFEGLHGIDLDSGKVVFVSVRRAGSRDWVDIREKMVANTMPISTTRRPSNRRNSEDGVSFVDADIRDD